MLDALGLLVLVKFEIFGELERLVLEGQDKQDMLELDELELETLEKLTSLEWEAVDELELKL